MPPWSKVSAAAVLAAASGLATPAAAQGLPAQPAQRVDMPPPPPAAGDVPVSPGPSTSARFSLADAYAAMTRGHPLLAAARAQVRAADSDVVAAGLWTNPQLNVTYTRSAGWTSYDPVIGYAQAGVTQLIETSGLPGARRRAAEINREATQADGETVRRGLMLDVQTAFVALAAVQARLEILRETEVQLERAERVVRARFEAGAAPRYDVSRIAVARADARASVGDAEADVIAARADLDVAVGPDAASLQGVPDFDLQNLPPLPALAALLQRLSEARPDLRAARLRAGVASAQVDIARRAVVQGIQLYVGTGVGAGYDPNVRQTQVDVVAGVTVPLPVVDRGQGAIPAAQRRAEAQATLATAAALAAEQRLQALHAEIVRRRQALEAYREAGVAGTLGMRREAEAGYREGRLSILELVDAYISVRDAQLRLVLLARDARTAEVNLWRAAGQAP